MRHYQRVSVSLIVRRVAGAAVLFWLVVTLIFALVRLAPGDPATLLVPPSATAEDAQRLRTDLGLDRPVAVQYARWAGGLLRGNFGDSFALHVPVARALADAAPVSIALGLASILLTFAIGVPLGLFQAAWRGRIPDRLTTVARPRSSPRRHSGSRSPSWRSSRTVQPQLDCRRVCVYRHLACARPASRSPAGPMLPTWRGTRSCRSSRSPQWARPASRAMRDRV